MTEHGCFEYSTYLFLAQQPHNSEFDFNFIETQFANYCTDAIVLQPLEQPMYSKASAQLETYAKLYIGHTPYSTSLSVKVKNMHNKRPAKCCKHTSLNIQ